MAMKSIDVGIVTARITRTEVINMLVGMITATAATTTMTVVETIAHRGPVTIELSTTIATGGPASNNSNSMVE